MTSCSQEKQDLVAYLLGELDETGARSVELHLEGCPSCRRELEGLKGVFNGVAAAHQDVERVMATVDWEALPERVARKVFDRPREAREPARGGLWRAPFLLRPAAAGLAAGLVLGALAAYFIIRPRPLKPGPEQGYYASGEFLDRVETELARRETLSYLDKSQDLLQDFLQPSALGSGGLWQAGYGQEQARSLLQKKKYINRQLEGRQMAKAKDICNQIELLILELAQIGPGLGDEERAGILQRVESSQLWLKINLLRKELQDSEAASL